MSRDPREEAERLVVAALAALSVAARSTDGFATGSAECCVCPLCKAIVAARDPDPQFAERLASGAGDLATGIAGVLRAFGAGWPGQTDAGPTEDSGASTAASGASTADAGSTAAEADTVGADRDTDVWRAATAGTTQTETGAASPPAKPMAKKAVKRAVRKIDPDT